ncbi:hypothetical protein [Chromobacterium sp. IIBBL 290-4]|uniref:hypothetical protein n=1 Tax=Chromobacterium sp. IIBBL 290-4 TaxID=2953890 RepID=UPI0020B7DFEB|nr:hypothetical protein [Chromobacterium sp. IIBBL 290-4]UTH74969.1 hypothetical protein NKT35_02365 [Chromobacterium sp. IIBBL 290-4]
MAQKPLFAAFLEDHEIALVGGGAQATTLAIGEESHASTLAIGEESHASTPLRDQITTLAVGEEGDQPPLFEV